jgi:hypothetical protein
MKRLVLILALLSFCALAYGRPKIIEETTRLEAPQSGLAFFAESVAIDGDWALATALRSADGSFTYPYQQLALLYRREGASWTFDRVLVNDATNEASWNYPSVAMKNGLAAVSTAPLQTFRLTSSGWIDLPEPFPAPVGNPSFANGLARIDGSTLVSVAGRCNYNAVTADFLGATWGPPQTVSGNARLCSVANYAGSLDADGNTLVVSNPRETDAQPSTSLKIYGRAAPGMPWSLDDTLPTGEWGFGVAVRGDELFVGGFNPNGTEIYRRAAAGWQRAGYLPTLEGFGRHYQGAFYITKNAEFILATNGQNDDRRSSIDAYRRSASGGYTHVARLVSSVGESLGPVIDISGRTVVAGGTTEFADDGRLYFFELPEQFSVPAVRQFDFEDGDTSRWRAESGEFAVNRRGANHILRQSESAGRATAVLDTPVMDSQSITADIRPNEFSAEDRWVGVATRYIDAANHFYVTLRSSGQVQLRRLRGGVVATLATRELPVAVNGNYRLRLESVGRRHRVFVNGTPQLEAFDGALPRGRTALLSYGAAADFDSVLVTPSPRVTIYDNDIVNGSECRLFISNPELEVSGSPAWDCTEFVLPYLRQTSPLGEIHAVLGPDTGDQVVESRVLAEPALPNGEEPKWLGVVTRYRCGRNHYLLTLRDDNTVSLHKVVDGVRTELDSVEYAVKPGTWHRLRLEAVGDRLRGYVNGVLRVQASDDQLVRGRSGIATHDTAARFDYFRVYQP